MVHANFWEGHNENNKDNNEKDREMKESFLNEEIHAYGVDVVRILLV